MNEYESLNHTKWECKYHVVFIPKYRRKALYGSLRKHLGSLFRELARHKESEIGEGHLMVDHVHMLLSIPPKYSVSQVMGYGLAGGRTVVEAEIEGVRSGGEVRSQVLLGPVDPDKQACLFGAREVLEPGDGPAGNNECVAWGDGEFIGDDREEVVHSEEARGFDFTEGREFQPRGEFRNCGVHSPGQYLALRRSSRHSRLFGSG